MTQVTAAMQEIIDHLGWAKNRTQVTNAAMSLARHVDARLTALEGAKPDTDAEPQARRMIAEIHRLEMDAYHAKADLAEAEAEAEHLKVKYTELQERYNNLLNSPAPISFDAWQAVKAENARLADRLDRITVTIDEVRRVKSALYKENERLTAEVERLTAERNALAVQLDDLRNVNAGLTAEVARLKGSIVATVNEINGDLAADNARLRSALQAVEWIPDPDRDNDTLCPWCGCFESDGHANYCQRQAALR